MSLSASTARSDSVRAGEPMAVVKVSLDTWQSMTASITRDAAEELGLERGTKVTVLVRSTAVMLAVDRPCQQASFGTLRYRDSQEIVISSLSSRFSWSQSRVRPPSLTHAVGGVAPEPVDDVLVTRENPGLTHRLIRAGNG